MNSTLDVKTSVGEITEFTRNTPTYRNYQRGQNTFAVASRPADRWKNADAGADLATSAVWDERTFVDRDELYADFAPLIHRLIRKYGDTPELREDLKGEIYCLFCGIVDAYDPERGVPLKPYIVHQLTSSVYTYARRHWRQERREVRLEFRDEVTVEGMPDSVDPSEQWNQDITMRQMQEFLSTAIAKLPLRQRQVVIWRYFEYRSFEDIAQVLGVQVATTRSILRHGLNNIRRSFDKADLRLEA